MSRRSPRYRVRFAATVEIADVGLTLVCHTRDISTDGCFLETSETVPRGVQLKITVMDNQSGAVVKTTGVARRVTLDGVECGIGVKLAAAPTAAWTAMVERYELASENSQPQTVRRSILVVGDEKERGGALALYVKSGWDVLFATDIESAVEALESASVDAVIAELPLDDSRWSDLMTTARTVRPDARRIVRTSLRAAYKSPPDPTLVHRFVDFELGLDALVDALTEPTYA